MRYGQRARRQPPPAPPQRPAPGDRSQGGPDRAPRSAGHGARLSSHPVRVPEPITRRQPNIKDCPLALSSADPCDRGTPCASECFERSDSQGRMDQDAGTLAGSGYQKVNAPPPGGRGSCRASAERWPAPVCPRRPPPPPLRGRSPVALGGAWSVPVALGGVWPVTNPPRRWSRVREGACHPVPLVIALVSEGRRTVGDRPPAKAKDWSG